MKIKLILILTALISFTSFSQKDIKSTVNEAIIFSNNAQITRYKTINLKPGENDIRFVGLEKSINQRSIQISGNEDVTVVSNTYQVINAPESDKPKELVKLEDSLAKLQRRITLNKNLLVNYRAEKAIILENRKVKGNNSSLVIEDLSDLTEFYRSNLQKLDVLMYDLSILNSKLNKQKGLLNQKKHKIGYNSRMGSISVKILANTKKSVMIKISYIANNVGWTPFYVIKSEGIDSKVKVSTKANIHQNTGVTWNNVKLKLSTSNPLHHGVLPTVHPWVLRFKAERKKYRSVNSPNFNNRNAQLNSTYSLSSTYTKSNRSMASFTKATNNLANREYEINLPYTVSGKNGKAVVEIEKFEMEADYLYYTAPKYDKNVYLIANIDNWEEHNLLPGNATIFLEGTYVGNTFINPNVMEDTMSLLLGKDLNITTDRTKLKQLSKSNFFGGNKTTEMAMLLCIKNKKGKDVQIIVEDQVPVSQDEKIVVNIKNISKAKHNKNTGVLTWKYTLKAGEKKEHKIIYSVKHPKNKILDNF